MGELSALISDAAHHLLKTPQPSLSSHAILKAVEKNRG
jgi:hypothetical protein